MTGVIRTPFPAACPPEERVALLGLGTSGMLLLHLSCLLVFHTRVSRGALLACCLCYWIRAFGITCGFHRYFSHRSFRTGRVFQFVLAWLGTAAMQRGPIWWVAHHRKHHKHSDQGEDVHSPTKGLWWAHMGWILCRKYDSADLKLVPDLVRYPELRWLERYFLVPPLSLAGVMYLLGWLHSGHGSQYLVWGFGVSTVLLYHATFSVNSLCHRFGSRPFHTRDDSRNNWFVAAIILGEGLHNNHHHRPASASFALRKRQIDVGYAILVLLKSLGLVWGLKVGQPQYRSNRQRQVCEREVGRTP